MRSIVNIVLFIVLFMGILYLAGCQSSTIVGQGETKSEGHRRHIRQLQIERQQLADDVDAFFLTDRPGRLSDLRIR